MNELEQLLLELFQKHKNINIVCEMVCMKKQDVKKILNKTLNKLQELKGSDKD